MVDEKERRKKIVHELKRGRRLCIRRLKKRISNFKKRKKDNWGNGEGKKEGWWNGMEEKVVNEMERGEKLGRRK